MGRPGDLRQERRKGILACHAEPGFTKEVVPLAVVDDDPNAFTPTQNLDSDLLEPLTAQLAMCGIEAQLRREPEELIHLKEKARRLFDFAINFSQNGVETAGLPTQRLKALGDDEALSLHRFAHMLRNLRDRHDKESTPRLGWRRIPCLRGRGPSPDPLAAPPRLGCRSRGPSRGGGSRVNPVRGCPPASGVR